MLEKSKAGLPDVRRRRTGTAIGQRAEGRRQGAGIRKGGNGQMADDGRRKALPNFECLMLNSQLKVEKRELKTAFSIFNFERLMFNV